MRTGYLGFLLFIYILIFAANCNSSDNNADTSDYSTKHLIELGKKIYRQGVLANGEPVKAYVMGDIEVLGTQFTCLNCHGQSGMGGAEGKTFTLAINPDALFKPRSDMYLERSEYDDKSLEESLRHGVTPEGIQLSPAMPVYDLPELEMTALITYLKNISSTFSPGVDDKEIHFATIVSETADPLAKKAMLDVIQGFMNDKNAKTRQENERVTRGVYWQHYRLKAYRKWVLHVWEVKGQAETWATQLEKHYVAQPVFAMIGGMITESWQPIHTFAENNEIPYLLPNTDIPGGLDTKDFYTLYFSEGLRLEARVMIADLQENKKSQRILQVFRDDPQGVFAAQSLQETAEIVEDVTSFNLRLGKTDQLTLPLLQKAVQENAADTLMLWLTAEELEELDLRELDKMIAGHTYLSASTLGGILAPLPKTLGNRLKLITPFLRPENQENNFDRIRYWLQRKKIAITHPRIQAQSFYLCMVLGEGLMHIKRHFYRDYLLDALDHGNAKSIFSVSYPRLSFGPGQRFLAKGAYVIENPHTGSDTAPAAARWTVPYM